MADTDWSKYDTCPTCLAATGKACQSMKGSGQLTRAHVGRQKLQSGIDAIRELVKLEPEARIIQEARKKKPSATTKDEKRRHRDHTQKRSSAPAITPGLTDNLDLTRYNEMAEKVNKELAKHHIRVTRQKLGEHWTWRATCSCGTLDGHYWGDDVSPKKEFERHLVPGK